MHQISLAIVYLARGAGNDHIGKFESFRKSYDLFDAGIPHKLYIIFKGFENEEAEARAEEVFTGLRFARINTPDLKFDIGAYADALIDIEEDYICFLNTNSEINSHLWLAKLIANLREPFVGAVGATGSYESLNFVDPDFPKYPNPHLRTNAFAISRALAVEILPSAIIRTKFDAWMFESGYNSLTQQIIARGLICLVVGKNGRGYGIERWPYSDTYRQGFQTNLLVHDNVTRHFMRVDVHDRRSIMERTWKLKLKCRIIDPYSGSGTP